MFALAGSSPALVPAIIGAVGSLVSAVILAIVALRAQSAREQLEQIRKIISGELTEREPLREARIAEIVRRALRETLGSDAHNRRWYDDGDG